LRFSFGLRNQIKLEPPCGSTELFGEACLGRSSAAFRSTLILVESSAQTCGVGELPVTRRGAQKKNPVTSNSTFRPAECDQWR
jgi:hypothetical protein